MLSNFRTLLLKFLKSLLSWLSSICMESKCLKYLAESMPLNVYYLKKLVGGESDITLYVSPKCYSIYQ